MFGFAGRPGMPACSSNVNDAFNSTVCARHACASALTPWAFCMASVWASKTCDTVRSSLIRVIPIIIEEAQ